MPNPISFIQPSVSRPMVAADTPNASSDLSTTTSPSNRDTYAPSAASNPYIGGARTTGVARDLNATRLSTARAAIVSEFKNKFVGSPEFQSTFGPKTWDDVKADVTAEAANFGATPHSEVFNDADGSTTFTGRIYGLYTEARINSQGQADKVYFEID